MSAQLTGLEALVFGADAVRDPATGLVLEQGRGALPHHLQVANYLNEIEARLGKEAAERASRGEAPEPPIVAQDDEHEPHADGDEG